RMFFGQHELTDPLKTSITTLQPGDMPVTYTGQLKYMSRPKPIIAQLMKSDRCSTEGLEVRANAPALAMCRKLIEAGYDPDRPLHCSRGETLASGVRLVPYSDGPQKSGAAPPMRFSDAAE